MFRCILAGVDGPGGGFGGFPVGSKSSGKTTTATTKKKAAKTTTRTTKTSKNATTNKTNNKTKTPFSSLPVSWQPSVKMMCFSGRSSATRRTLLKPSWARSWTMISATSLAGLCAIHILFQRRQGDSLNWVVLTNQEKWEKAMKNNENKEKTWQSMKNKEQQAKAMKKTWKNTWYKTDEQKSKKKINWVVCPFEELLNRIATKIKHRPTPERRVRS